MRKRLAILILLSMTVSLLCGTVFAERPATVNSAKAGIRVDLARGGTYYFETLTPELFLWLSTEAGENSTVTLLQDLTLSSKEGTNFLSLGQTVGDTPAIVLDLNDFRLYYHGPSNLFAIPYDGDLTVKNGTVYYECTGNSRSPFVLGATSSQQCDPADASVGVTPRLRLQDMAICSGNPETGRIINCFQWMADISVEDSFLWTYAAKSAAIDMRKSTQKDSETVQWKGDYSSTVRLTGSTVGTAGNYALASADACTFTVEETTLVSTVAVKDPTTPGTIHGIGEAITAEWKGMAPDGAAVQGTGITYATPQAEEEVSPAETEPNSGIPEWFRPPVTGVSILGLAAPAALSLLCAAAVMPKKKH